MLSAHDQMQPVNTAIGEQKHYEKPKLWFLGKNEAALGATTPKDSLIHHIELMGEAWFSGCHSGQHAKKCAYPRLRCCRPEAAQWPEHGCMRFDTWLLCKVQPMNSSKVAQQRTPGSPEPWAHHMPHVKEHHTQSACLGHFGSSFLHK